MCIIIDANVASKLSPCSADAKPVVEWLMFGRGKLVYGGKNADELLEVASARRFIAELYRAGRAVLIDEAKIKKSERDVSARGICYSNDIHVIALAIASGARLLYSHDAALHADFKNKDLIDNPRGSIYQNVAHARLLRECTCHGAS